MVADDDKARSEVAKLAPLPLRRRAQRFALEVRAALKDPCRLRAAIERLRRMPDAETA
jgi:hypothetical protein